MEGAIERFCLPDGTREAVEHQAGGRVGLLDALEQHADGELVRDEVALRHELLRLEAELRALSSGVAEHVAGRNVQQRLPLREDACLCALTDARQSEEDETHQEMNPS